MYAEIYQRRMTDKYMATALKGIRGLVEYTTDGSAEFLKYKDVWLPGFEKIGQLENGLQIQKSLVNLCCEMFHLLAIMLRKQGETIVKKQKVMEFPRQFYRCVSKGDWIEPNARVKCTGALLAAEVLFVLAKVMRHKDRNMLKKWKLKLK